ncbi:transcription elongation factor s-ii [Moniliophthora roreri]|uniref:Transcription elongation factor n=1 Tax=Moniliophthora roreri TaxID=221103 RepID=A0A0W0FKK7_MONRR|nr:transcription elongation factor s-ii [Moniliophthora roreri]
MSSDPAELKKLVKQLQSASNNTKDILGILSILKRDFQINEAILRESKAGLAVGKLRNSSTKEVADAAKDLVKKWKAEVDKAKASSGSTSKPQASKSSTNGPATPVTPTASTAKTETRTAKSDGVTINFTGDKTRDKCTELIYDALVSDSGAPSELVSKKARDVELAVFNSHGGATAEYRARIRSLFVNLKDKNNPGLRESVVSGLIAADKLAKMSSDEMASEERKAADQKIKQDNFFASLGAEEQQAETDAFQCGRCKQRKCRYRQAQTRSADEPMTTFVTCTNCGNRWKFS